MPIDVRRATAEDICEFITWRYEPPFDTYDVTDTAEEAVEYFSSSEANCHALVDGGTLVGYATFGHDARVPGGDYDEEALDIGMGIRPDLIGKGRGADFIEAAVSHARSELGTDRLRVTISEANERALRAAQRAGFAEVGRFTSSREVLGTTGFVILER